jgi:glycosyltransferase involved in cell wall biosynthesis
MRILWFTNTPSNASQEFGYQQFGGGWISSLETLIVKSREHELGVCFFYSGSSYKRIVKGGTIYYGIPGNAKSGFQRIISRHMSRLEDESPAHIDEVIRDFNPDIIQVFGTESGYGRILRGKFDRVVFHLQGLTGPYSEVYFPPGFSRLKIRLNSTILQWVRGDTFLHRHKLMKKKGEREAQIVKYWRYYIGRTDWDRNYVSMLNKDSIYFHCEELLRASFFESEWVAPSADFNKEIVIGTTVNPNIYKGLDLIYKVLERLSGYPVRWKVFGITENDAVNKLVRKVLRIRGNERGIAFFGQVPEADLIRELNSCHFFVHPSYIDNSPNSVCEAMLLGMPVISSSVGGMKALIDDGVNGFLHNPYDDYDLAGLLIHLVNNYALALSAGKTARKDALKRHSPAAIFERMNHIYHTISKD